MPQDLAATLAYLSSGALPYIGPATAKKIVEHFGADCLEVIANDPLRLTELRGITPEKAAAISNEFRRMFGVREAVAYLGRFGISPVRAVEVYRHLGPSAVEEIGRNPYILCGEPSDQRLVDRVEPGADGRRHSAGRHGRGDAAVDLGDVPAHFQLV